ncbi:MAG TPA: hypothetical protein VMI32_08400 [Candidatus Solibacter sp.]|nr:hypothetical protein [Candidatus Solibacter sp.]
MRTLRLIAFSALLATFLPSASEAGALRIALLASAEVQGDTILLASLLPANATRHIRSVAGQITLGAAPQRGTIREFTRDSLTAAISSAGLSPADFAIPGSVTVRRDSRLLSSQEVFDAIKSALAKNPIPSLTRLRLQDLSFEAAVRVAPGDAALEVTQISFDQFLHRARFRLLPTSTPGVLPLYATAKVPSAFSERSTTARFLPAAAHVPIKSLVSAPALVATGRLARLHIHTPGLDMLLEVSPLQRGHFGEVIRVRLPGTGRTFQARVTGEEYLDATL